MEDDTAYHINDLSYENIINKLSVATKSSVVATLPATEDSGTYSGPSLDDIERRLDQIENNPFGEFIKLTVESLCDKIDVLEARLGELEKEE